MAKPTNPDAEGRPLVFHLSFDHKPEEPIDVWAFAFDRQGNLIARAPLTGGEAELELTGEQARKARLFFASLPEREQEITIEALERLRAYEPTWQFDPERREYELLPIPEILWKWWLHCRCRVRGRVVKPVEIGGVTYDRPVCNARVHICEVDRLSLVIPRLPDDIIWRLRDELLEKLRHPFPLPEPDPPPFVFDPGVIDPSPINVARMARERLAKMPAPRLELDTAARLEIAPAPPERTLMSPQRLEMGGLPASDRAALISSSITEVRRALIDHAELIRPWICWWPWFWPYVCTCDEVATVVTDHQGRFDTEIWYPCFGDHPDLYFWVEYSIGGTWTTVLHPPICCNTHWNYPCGSEVTLRVTDPRVSWCGDEPPLPGKQVAVLSVGNNVSMTEIQRQSAGASEGLTTTGQPFGGSLEPHAWFGEDLRPSGITHYRWSYRRLGSSGEWTALDHEVVRHYAEVMPDSTLVFKPFDLGPDPAFPGQSLFQIRPPDPPLNPGVASSSWAPEVDGRSNTASAYLRSHLLEGGDPLAAADKYELKLELFKSDGSLVNWTDEGVLLKVPTVNAPFGLGTVPTELVAHAPAQPGDMEDRVIRDGTGKIVAFRLVLHIDNNPCTAEIHETTVGTSTAGPCGFIAYPPSANATISFTARHPNDFATFTFRVNRGSTGTVAAASASGPVAGPTVNGFTRDAASRYTKSVPVATLLGTCLKAAFSETLHVDALATDGWSGTLDYLDDDASSKAFALEPA